MTHMPHVLPRSDSDATPPPISARWLHSSNSLMPGSCGPMPLCCTYIWMFCQKNNTNIPNKFKIHKKPDGNRYPCTLKYRRVIISLCDLKQKFSIICLINWLTAWKILVKSPSAIISNGTSEVRPGDVRCYISDTFVKKWIGEKERSMWCENTTLLCRFLCLDLAGYIFV